MASTRGRATAATERDPDRVMEPRGRGCGDLQRAVGSILCGVVARRNGDKPSSAEAPCGFDNLGVAFAVVVGPWQRGTPRSVDWRAIRCSKRIGVA